MTGNNKSVVDIQQSTVNRLRDRFCVCMTKAGWGELKQIYQ